MSSEASRFILAAALAVPAIVWGIVAFDIWTFRLARRPRSRVSRLLPWLATLMAFVFSVATAFALVPWEWHLKPTPPMIALYCLSDLAVLMSIAIFRHLTRVFPLAERPPSRAWLRVNYGGALLAFWLFDLGPVFMPGLGALPIREAIRLAFIAYIVVMLGLSLLQIRRFARSGVWTPGGLGEARSADVLILAIGVFAMIVLFTVTVRRFGWTWGDPGWYGLFSAAIGLVLALPLAARILGRVVRSFLFIVVTLGGALAIAFGGRAVRAAVTVELEPLIDVATVVALFVLLVPARAWVLPVIDRAVFRRRRHRHRELQEFLQGLSPELGVEECCRRMLAAVARVMQLRAAAFLFDDGRPSVVLGDLAIEPLERVWPRGDAAHALPGWGFGPGTFRELAPAVQEALIETAVVGVVPVASRQRRWGCAVVTAGPVNASLTDDDTLSLAAVADHFARLLDGADLLARTVAVERALAHAEKLAAIGETAARIAHEIRNPVTAARSLAQQLCAEPAAPFREEHEIILAELARIERQVAALLRFARRDELTLAPVELGALVRQTVDHLGARLAAGGIATSIDATGPVVARADREQLRQVLVNVLENAIDALAGVTGERRLAVGVTGNNGTARIAVADNGIGMAPDALARIFEPFFSLKPTGTGLGLAIARRTIEAHGGRLSAAANDGAGLVLHIELPAAAEEGVS